jgi:Domain of unknown function (DUF4470)
MSIPLIYRGVHFFYPIGNTSAFCLTKDVAPEVPANILLLGCGDTRHILYTIFSENRSSKSPLPPLDLTIDSNLIMTPYSNPQT